MIIDQTKYFNIPGNGSLLSSRTPCVTKPLANPLYSHTIDGLG